MRVLVTGASGFVGRHLVAELEAVGHVPVCFDRSGQDYGEIYYPGDVRTAQDIGRVIESERPDACVHLGGIAFVPSSWEDPRLVFDVNLMGTINLLEVFRHLAPKARILVVSSSEIYGHGSGDQVLDEDAPLKPLSPYAVTKEAADQMSLLYAKKHGLNVMTVRPSNHIGPGQSPLFVTASFAKQVAHIARGGADKKMRVGNLECVRSFADVRDVVCAYRLLLEKGHPGEAYNVGVSRTVTIRFILEYFCRLAGVSPKIEIDDKLFRKAEQQAVLSTAKIQKHTGWSPKIPLETTLKDIYRDAMS